MLYGVHLWADLDRDRRLGGSMPNQNDYVFVILVTHPKPYIETTDRRVLAANSQSGGEDGCYREKIPEFFLAWAATDPKTEFSRFYVPFGYPAHSLQEIVYPKLMVPMESLDSESMLFVSLWVWPGIWQI